MTRIKPARNPEDEYREWLNGGRERDAAAMARRERQVTILWILSAGGEFFVRPPRIQGTPVRDPVDGPVWAAVVVGVGAGIRGWVRWVVGHRHRMAAERPGRAVAVDYVHMWRPFTASLLPLVSTNQAPIHVA